jgi:hypothetical protein
MSTLKVDGIRSNSASSDAITLASDGTCTANITNRSNRNKIINGGMTVSQRQTSSTSSSVFVVDRFKAEVTQMDELVQTLEQSSDAPDGFGKSIKITTTTPESSIASNEQFRIQTKLEGQDFQDLAYGTSAAKTITISFYVKASITGTFGFTVYRAESTARVITAPYTISSADTWERKTITISGDTAGAAITNDNAERFRLMWALASGSDYTTASSSWSNYSSAKLLGGHVTNTLVTTNNATWQLAGVQLEVSDHATDFEHRSYAQELALCQRYYFKITADDNDSVFLGYSTNGSNFYGEVPFPTSMRTMPTFTGSSTAARYFSSNVSDDFTISNLAIHGAHTSANPHHTSMYVAISSADGGTAGVCQAQNAVGTFEFSAEL